MGSRRLPWSPIATAIRRWHAHPARQASRRVQRLPDLVQHANATNITLSFKSLYEIEWDWDYGFVMVSTDGGASWTEAHLEGPVLPRWLAWT